MQLDNWSLIKEIVADVLELPVNERLSYLDGLSVSNEIRLEIASLIAFEEEAADLMQLSAVELSKDFIEADEFSLAGREIGPYRVVSELGHGGMGAVYLAERVDGKFEQRVALKLLKRELNTSALRRRFEHEREILSKLEHPNIARLLDAGSTDDGIPYLAMEFIDGVPIDQYCARGPRELNERLELFRQVCSAVDFAHKNLVVHRDLKPSNILVTADGTPKLLDFGISKILSENTSDAETVTRLGVMTPGYASPEQLRSESVTTSTDVYSLGIVLYELLSGHRPFETNESNLEEVYRAVLETDPPLPSLRAETGRMNTDQAPDKPKEPNDSKTLPDLTRITKAPIVSIKPHQLRGDLDNIILKALKKEPERRYPSPESFSEDIRRYLAGLPVSARPDTFAYRASKFAARNRLSVFAGTLVVLAILGGGATTLWQARIAQIESEKAEKRFLDVRGLANSFLTEFSPLIENLPGTTPARKLLVTRALEYLDKLSIESNDDPQLLRELATAYEKVGDVQGNPYNPNIGDVKGALQSYERALSIREGLRDRNLIGAMDAADAALFEKLGSLHSNGGDHEKAVTFYEQALVLRRAILNTNPHDYDARVLLARALRSRGLIPFFEGNNKIAIEYYNGAREIYEQLILERPADDRVALDRGYIFIAIGEAYGWDGEFALAGDNLQKGLDFIVPLAEKYPSDISFQRTLNLSYNKRAENYEDTEKFDLAVVHYGKGIEIAKRSFISDPTNFQAKRDVALGYKKMAQALDGDGKSRESEENLIFALETFIELSHADPNNSEALYDVANTRFSLGETYVTLKDHQKALDTFLTAKEEFQRVLTMNPDSPYAVRMSTYNFDRIGKCYVALASSKKDSSEFLRVSLEYFKRAYASFEKMKADGKIGDYDLKAMPEMEANIRELEKKVS